MKNSNNDMYKKFDISDKVIDFVSSVEEDLKDKFSKVDKIAEINQYKVLSAMQEERLSDTHFNWNTGYGYDDAGREVTEKIFARAFGGESALVIGTNIFM